MKPPKQAEVGPAPPPPEPVAEATDPQGNRKVEDKANYGSTAPSLRVNRDTAGTTGTGGTGLRM